jgi:hypothetical protein
MKRPLLALSAVVVAAGCRQILDIQDKPVGPTPVCGMDIVGACWTCAEARCCPEIAACARSPECKDLAVCLAGCQGEPTCRSQCTLDNPLTSAFGLAGSLAACLASHCADTCGITCGGLTEIAGAESAVSCQDCIVANNCQLAQTCAVSAACQAHTLCRLNCMTGDCVDACDLADPAGTVTYNNFISPLISHCQQSCAIGAGPCTTDAQCAAENPATPICNTTKGKCVAGACTPGTTNPPTACNVNASDVCCTTTCQAGAPSGGVACCPTADSTTYCTTQLGGVAATCVGNLCTPCPPVTSGNYIVDPVNGNEKMGTGYGAQAGCAFKTITRALAVIGTPTSATTITVVGPSTVGAGETFPIVLPAKLTLMTSNGAVTVNVPAGDNGFTLNSAGTTITGASGAPLTISGQSEIANIGINAFGKSTAATTISNLTVSGFAQAGINVGNNAVLTIGPGVKSNGNIGRGSNGADGLDVHVSAHVIIDVPAGSATTSFDGNGNIGINVFGNANITLTGSVTSATAGTGTVTANGNLKGLVIATTSGTPPQSVIDGLVSFGNWSPAIQLAAGANVQLRNSVALQTHYGSGILVTNQGGTSSDVSQIDLGTGTSPGLNTVQDVVGGAEFNTSGGICLDLPAGTTTLEALGNIFGSTNCSTTAGTLAIDKKSTCQNFGVNSCTGGVACDLGVTTAGNDINVMKCTHP